MILADTGYFLALANQKDTHHAVAVAASKALRERLVTTWPVLTETCHLLSVRLGTTAVLAFVTLVKQGGVDVFALEDGHWPRLEELMLEYRDLPMDLADASLVLLAEHLGSGRILSTDRRDFRAYRWKNHRPFRNLLLRD